MARARTAALPALFLAVVALSALLLQRPTFVSPPGRPAGSAAPVSVAAGAAAVFAAAPAAYADQLGDASKKFADASYPLIQQIDWGRTPVLSKWLKSAAEGWSPGIKIGQAMQATLESGVYMDPKLVAASIEAHDKAVLAAKDAPGLVTPLAEHEAVTESIARMFASAPPQMVRGVFDAYAKVGVQNINKDWFATLSNADARASFDAFYQLSKEVRIAWQAPKTEYPPLGVKIMPPNYDDQLGSAAKELADVSYPLLKKIDWERTPVLTKWLGEQAEVWDEQKLAAAMDSTLKASAAMDPKLITQAVAVHADAVKDALADPKLVTPLADHEAVTESIVRMLASAPPDKVKAVFDTFAEVGLKDLNAAWFATLDAEAAEAAYKTFLAMSEVLKAGR